MNAYLTRRSGDGKKETYFARITKMIDTAAMSIGDLRGCAMDDPFGELRDICNAELLKRGYLPCDSRGSVFPGEEMLAPIAVNDLQLLKFRRLNGCSTCVS